MDEEPALLTGSAPARKSMLLWLAVTAAMTPVAVLAGALVGWALVEVAQKPARPAPAAIVVAREPRFPLGTRIVELAPVITNLADPAETWVRFEAAIALDVPEGGTPELVTAQIAEDILGYLRTISLASINGASGLRHLREDLEERARIRSDGKVRELVIRTLVVQ